MATHFITVLNGVITGQHCGDINANLFDTPYYGHERIEIPRGVNVSNFDKPEFYTKDWKRKSNEQLINEGLIPMPKGYLFEGDNLRQMTREERIIEGLEEPPSGYKVKDGSIVEMTIKEKIKAGVISQETYNAQLEAEASAELNRRLSALQNPEALAAAELDKTFAASRLSKLQALMKVKEQPGWPFDVAWPD